MLKLLRRPAQLNKYFGVFTVAHFPSLVSWGFYGFNFQSIMNAFKFFYVILTILLFITKAQCQTIRTTPFFIDEVLGHIDGYQFTIEQTDEDKLTFKSFTSCPKTIDDLRFLLSDYDITPDINNPHVLHIVRKLIRTENYPLTKELTEFNYSGPAYHLLGKLPHIVPDHSSPEFASTLDATPIHVSVKNKTCIEIITECMPLDHFGPILWTATLNPDSTVAVDFWLKSTKFTSLEDALSAVKAKNSLKEVQRD